MHYSFIYRSHRIDVDLRAHREGWVWRYDLHDGPPPRSGSTVFDSKVGALQSACLQARRDIDLLVTTSTT